MKASELREKALAWRQNELDKRGADWRYKPSPVEVAYETGYRAALEDVRSEIADEDDSPLARILRKVCIILEDL